MDVASRYKALAKTSIDIIKDYTNKIRDLTKKLKTKELTEAEYTVLLNTTMEEMSIVQRTLQQEYFRKVVIGVKL